MRDNDNFDPDDEVKERWLVEDLKDPDRVPIDLIFEDRDCNVKMFRDYHQRCLQVAEGGY